MWADELEGSSERQILHIFHILHQYFTFLAQGAMEVFIFLTQNLPQVRRGDFAETFPGRLIQDQAIASRAQPLREKTQFL
jgi:hypothetical protein